MKPPPQLRNFSQPPPSIFPSDLDVYVRILSHTSSACVLSLPALFRQATDLYWKVPCSDLGSVTGCEFPQSFQVTAAIIRTFTKNTVAFSHILFCSPVKNFPKIQCYTPNQLKKVVKYAKNKSLSN